MNHVPNDIWHYRAVIKPFVTEQDRRRKQHCPSSVAFDIFATLCNRNTADCLTGKQQGSLELPYVEQVRITMSRKYFAQFAQPIASVMLATLSVGCSSLPFNRVVDPPDSATGRLASASEARIVNDPSRLIALNFARLLVQIPDVNPEQVPVGILSGADENTDFAEALHSELVGLNYAVRLGDAGAFGLNISYEVSDANPPDTALPSNVQGGIARVYELSVADIGLRRLYSLLPNGEVKPLMPMEARGLDVSQLVVDDSIFNVHSMGLVAQGTSPDPALTALSDSSGNSDSDLLSSVNPAEIPSSATVLATNTLPATVQEASGAAATRTAIPRTAEVPDNFSKIPFQATLNVRDLGKSNYFELFEQALVLDTYTIEFPNDSASLTAESKASIAALAKEFAGSQGIISIIGASHGRGQYEGAQQDLARARAAAVATMLEDLGIDATDIYPEASWSETYYDEVLPRRAAVVTFYFR